MTNILNSNEVPEILRQIRKVGGKYIVVENGKPAFVVMDINEYKKIIDLKKKEGKVTSEKALIDKINADIADWKMKQDEEKKDYSEYIPKRFRDEDDDFVEDDLAYHYDVDEDDEDYEHNYGEDAPF